MQNRLTNEEAFNSMRLFLEEYYKRTSSDDIGSLLGDLILLADQTTADPAAWEDWMDCVKKVKEKEYPL